MEDQVKRKEQMYYLIIAKDIRPEAETPNRVTIFNKKDIVEKILVSIKSIFILLKMPKTELDSFSTSELAEINLEEVLEAEAAKYLKKSYDKKYDAILNKIIQVG